MQEKLKRDWAEPGMDSSATVNRNHFYCTWPNLSNELGLF